MGAKKSKMLVEGLRLLEEYKIPVPKYWVNEIPGDIEFPLVVKADLNHKSDKGAVIKDILSVDHLQCAIENLRLKFPDKDIIIQKQITGHFVETIIGVKRDPTFEYFVLFGIGGTITEILRDFVILVPPFNKEDFMRQLDYLKLKKVLFGFRSFPKVDLDKVYNVICNLCRILLDKDLKEIEVNPLICTDKKVYAVDVRFFK